MSYSVCTFSQKPGLRDQIDQLSGESWPPFLLHGDIEHWHFLFDVFPVYQLLFCDSAGRLIGAGHTVPLVWDGTESDLPPTIEGTLLRAERASRDWQTPNTLCALAAMVSASHRGQNLSRSVVEAMIALTSQHRCTALIAPLRPTWKSRYPLTPMERYVQWTRADGAPLDPWLRVHWRLGATPLCVAPNTLSVEGTVGDWEEWTQMPFPDSGSYVVPGALQPVEIDRERNTGRYEDPNYWVKHAVGPPERSRTT